MRSSVYVVEIIGDVTPAAEIDEMRWIDLTAAPDLLLAPLLESRILPALNASG